MVTLAKVKAQVESRLIDRIKILSIVRRVAGAMKDQGIANPIDSLDLFVAVETAHDGCCPLQLDAMLAGQSFNLLHDVLGLYHHVNLETGEVSDKFLPRYAQK